jgi:hypothetical protein
VEEEEEEEEEEGQGEEEEEEEEVSPDLGLGAVRGDVKDDNGANLDGVEGGGAENALITILMPSMATNDVSRYLLLTNFVRTARYEAKMSVVVWKGGGGAEPGMS